MVVEDEEGDDSKPATRWNPALVGQSWSWTTTVPCTPELVSAPAAWVGAGSWSPLHQPEPQQVLPVPPATPAHAPPPPPMVPWPYPLKPPPDLTKDESDGHD